MRWLAAILGWLAAAYLAREYFNLRKAAQKLATEAAQLVGGIFRVRLSCPACPWTEDIVRESREAAMLAGDERIREHNEEMGHLLEGTPKAGYFRGEPLN